MEALVDALSIMNRHYFFYLFTKYFYSAPSRYLLFPKALSALAYDYDVNCHYERISLLSINLKKIRHSKLKIIGTHTETVAGGGIIRVLFP